MTKKCICLQKYLVNSKKSSNFARFFVRTVKNERLSNASIAQLVEH